MAIELSQIFIINIPSRYQHTLHEVRGTCAKVTQLYHLAPHNYIMLDIAHNHTLYIALLIIIYLK